MVLNQAYLFLIFTLNGILISILFDFFRVLRKCFKTNNIITYIEDVLFWVLSGISILVSMYYFSNGELRLYMILGLCIGIVLYVITLSKYVIKLSVSIINKLKRLTSIIIVVVIYPIKILYKLINSIFLNPVHIFYTKINKLLQKKTNKFKKINKTKGFF